jgi:Xaa-Pro aminopeptidase
MDSAPFASRRARYLDALGADAALLVSSAAPLRNGDTAYRPRVASDVRYLCGWDEEACVILLRPGTEQPFAMFVPPRDRDQETWTGRRHGVEGARERFGADVAFPLHELAARLPVLLQGHPGLHFRLGTDPDLDRQVLGAMAAARSPATRNGLRAPRSVHDPAPLLAQLRLLKDAHEISCLRRAADIAGRAHLAAMRAGRAGVTEAALEAIVESTFRTLGADAPGYPTIVGSGVNATILHYARNSDTLRPGTLCLLDAGCEVDGYTADITRTWPVSGHFSGPQRELYEVVLAAQAAGLVAARAGRPFRGVHDAATRALAEGMVAVGLLRGDVGELVATEAHRRHYMHGTSHWLGLDVHDAGDYQVDGRSRLLQPGMVLTIEPGLYIREDDADAPEAFRGVGIRVEDDVLVTEGEPEILSAACPRDVEKLEAACATG